MWYPYHNTEYVHKTIPNSVLDIRDVQVVPKEYNFPKMCLETIVSVTWVVKMKKDQLLQMSFAL